MATSTPSSAPASAGAETNLGAPASTTKPAGAKRGGKKADKAEKPASGGKEVLTEDSKGQQYLPEHEKLGVKALVDCVIKREGYKKQKKHADESLTNINTVLRGLIETHKDAFETDSKGNLVYDDGDIEIHVVTTEEKITTKLKKKDGESTSAADGGKKKGGKKKVTVNDVF